MDTVTKAPEAVGGVAAAHAAGPFWIACSADGDGAIRDVQGGVVLRVEQAGRKTRLLDASSQEVFVITRHGVGLFSWWALTGPDALACEIRRRGLWLNRFTIEFAGGPTWTARFPLFTTLYPCTSDQGEQFLVRLVQHTAWYVEKAPATTALALMAGLVAIQGQRQWA